jgi:hypothetical protein
MRVVWRSLQGDHPTPGRGQAIAPTMLRIALPGSSIVGAHPCGRPVGVSIRLSSPDKQMEELIGINAHHPRPYAIDWLWCPGNRLQQRYT